MDTAGNSDVAAQLAYGQLATPALSPISEQRSVQPLLGAKEDTPTPDRRRAGLGGRHASEGTLPELGRRRGSSAKILKLSPVQIHELVAEEDSVPVRPALAPSDGVSLLAGECDTRAVRPEGSTTPTRTTSAVDSEVRSPSDGASTAATIPSLSIVTTPGAIGMARPNATRSSSTPISYRKHSTSRVSKSRPALSPLNVAETDFEHSNNNIRPVSARRDTPFVAPSPMPAILPAPPLSLSTYLELELSSDRPSALYLHRSASSDFPYESSKVKFERLLYLLQLPLYLEEVLWFGAIACLDAWLYTFTILPLRFLKAIAILIHWWFQCVTKDVHGLSSFVYGGMGRVWRRRKLSTPEPRQPSMTDSEQLHAAAVADAVEPVEKATAPTERRTRRRQRSTRSRTSALLPNHKADILQGLLIIISCTMLMYFDASRSYHSIRGQSAIKLYVIYNVLEVFDRLLSALGQDILECLFSEETLQRDASGRSKVLRPLWMFVAALVYNIVHSAALFYQVVTLNVAVNSYSNALLTLLMSNQFVEIKGTVFKKFEKENLFQLTCADIVERFQLWLMLVIIALRNIVEVGGLSISLGSIFATSTVDHAANMTELPQTFGFAIPKAFTLMPNWTGEVLGPFLFVLLSEMAVDWLKHGYISKFNNVKPTIYGRFLDVLAKDYYSHAFVDQNLTKRLGLPVIPLSCLFIRACMQTYHMFLATHMPLPMPSAATALEVESSIAPTSPATIAALRHIDHIFRRALGRSSFGAGADPASSRFQWWSLDDFIAFATMITFFLALYLILLACKLLLGMLLLSYSRRRYSGMRERERTSFATEGRRVGGWGVTEVGEEKRRWIYEDDPDALKELRDKEDRGRKKGVERDRLDGVERYYMAGKRIW